jgi:single-stranded DNA-binding protein
MPYNLVTLSGTVDSNIEYIEYKPDKHFASFKLKFYTAKQAGTITIAAYDNVAEYVQKVLKEGSTVLIKGNLNQYNNEHQIIANSIEIVDSSGKVVSSVKKETRKEWPSAGTRDKASAAENPASESPNELLKEALNG